MLLSLVMAQTFDDALLLFIIVQAIIAVYHFQYSPNLDVTVHNNMLLLLTATATYMLNKKNVSEHCIISYSLLILLQHKQL